MSGDIHNMADKIARHEKSKTHINAASIYGQWNSEKTVDKDSEMLTKNNISSCLTSVIYHVDNVLS